MVASETAALDIIGASFVREVAPGELLAIDARAAQHPVRDPGAEGLPVRVRLPGPAGHSDLGRAAALGPGRGRAHPGPGVPDRGRPGHPGAGVRHPRRDRVRRGVGHPVWAGAGQELLRRAHLHPTQPDHPAARHPAQAEPAARRDCRQAAGGGRRLDRPRQHPARTVRMLREAGATEVHVRISSPPVKWPCFYGIDFRLAGRADRQWPGCRGGVPLDRGRTRSATSRWTAWWPQRTSARTPSAGPASTGSTRLSCRSAPGSASTCWRMRHPTAPPGRGRRPPAGRRGCRRGRRPARPAHAAAPRLPRVTCHQVSTRGRARVLVETEVG